MTMTRETKVGLVVCLSFLCLVGVVLSTKLRGDGAEEDEQVVEDQTPDHQPIGSASRDQSPAARIPTQPATSTMPPVIQTAAVQNAQPLPPPPSTTIAPRQDQPFVGPKLPEEELAISSPQDGDGANRSVALPPPPKRESQPVNNDEQPLDDSADVVWLPFFGSVKLPVDSSELAAVPAPTNGPGPPEVAPPPSSSPVPAGSDPQSASADGKLDRTSKPAPAAVAEVSSPSTAGASGTRTPAPSVARGTNSETGGALTAPSTSANNAQDATRLNAGEVALAVPPPPAATTTAPPSAALQPPVPPPGTPISAGSDSSGNAAGRAAVSAPASDPKSGPQTHSIPAAQPIVPVSANGDPRPIGSVPTVTTPPIPVPSPGVASATRPAAPQVESYDEEAYRLKPGDTFAKISAAHFNTDKYAKALERFNVNHPFATDNMRLDPPRLDSGQLVYIPPAYILEKRYATTIPGYKPSADPAGAPEAPRTSKASPRAESPGSTPQGFKWYQVRPQGEAMRDTARTALGNAERWTEISKLNPTLDPAYMIRGGSLIKVPADARIEPAAAPR